ncbi:hypothetical protein COOONC_20658 [Cooperia oncophora]
MGKAFNFCFKSSSLKCGCVSDAAKSCERVRMLNQGDITACKLHEPMRVPRPILRTLSNTSLSIVVDRFFSRPPFDVLNPSRLMLLADFIAKVRIN